LYNYKRIAISMLGYNHTDIAKLKNNIELTRHLNVSKITVVKSLN
jgi:DNA-binding GntR family transcriptional regulator